MASKVARVGGWQIRWRKGRAGDWQSEFFPVEYDADVFKLDVERAGNNWPPGWVPGRGYLTAEQLAAEDEQTNCTLFLPYANKRIERLYGSKRIDDDTLGKYKGYAKAFTRAVPVAERLAEVLAEDEELRLDVMEDPARGRHILDGLVVEERADLCIEDVDRDLIADWVVYQRVRGVTPKTIGNHHGFLHGVFDQAFESGLLARNPCRKTELQAATPTRPKIVLERDEFWLVHDAVNPDHQEFVETAVGTGLRFGELTALMAGAWDRERQMLLVQQAWKKARHGFKIGAPKTSAGIRQVYVGDTLAEIIDRRCHGREDHDLLFTAPRGGQIRQNTFWMRRWEPALHKAVQNGLPEEKLATRFHDLRHTHTSWLRDGGLHDDAIMHLVGHSDEAMTGRYGSVTKRTIDIAVATIEDSLRRVA